MEIGDAFASALKLVVHFESNLVEIVTLSFRVSFLAVGVASLIGFPIGALLAVFKFPGRSLLVVLLNAMMGLPPVVIGLVVYLILSRSGPLGTLGLLYSPTAMVVAQVCLITPIIAALTRQATEDLWLEYSEQLKSLGVGPWQSVNTLLWDSRFSLVTIILAGFGRASAEVGAVMIVGGNIDHLTRVMTTAIALETSRGDLALALGLGFLLVLLSIVVNATVFVVNESTAPRHSVV